MPTYDGGQAGGGGFSPIAQPYAATIVLDLSQAGKPLFLITLTGPATIQAINGTPGNEFAVLFTQANGGGHSVTWDSDFRESAEVPLESTTSALDADDYFAFLVNGVRGTYDHLAKNKAF